MRFLLTIGWEYDVDLGGIRTARRFVSADSEEEARHFFDELHSDQRRLLKFMFGPDAARIDDQWLWLGDYELIPVDQVRELVVPSRPLSKQAEGTATVPGSTSLGDTERDGSAP